MPELVARQVEAMLLDGRLKPGERLPAERVLCERLKVSRNTLREALKELRARGVIESRRGSGTYVAVFQEFQPSSPMQKLLQNHPSTLTGLLEVRRLLEGEAAYLAAKRATDEELVELKIAYENVALERPDSNTNEEHAKRDIAFHRAIYGAAHNLVLMLALNSIRDLMTSFVFDTAGKLYPVAMTKRQLRTQHRRIFRAIEKRDPAAARRAAHTHIDAVAASIREFEQTT